LHALQNQISVYTNTSLQKAGVQFTWDERINQQKHGISFETAVLVFDDILQVSRPERTVDGETRWQTIGMVNGIHVLLVAHTISESGSEEGDEETIRIVSARKATPRERRVYAEEEI
jgi:uncharacterized DUF497 family protein